MTSNFNWYWVNPISSTKKESGSIPQDTVSLYTFKQAARGIVSSSDINSFVLSTNQNIQSLASFNRAQIRPILLSLPAGAKDRRWSIDNTRALPEKIDCFSYGVQGSTLFVFNDASLDKADGRYWVEEEHRPKTIAEKLEDLYKDISNISAANTEQTVVDLDPLWAAIGESYRTSGNDSLDSRVNNLESFFPQLENDIYDPENTSYGLGQPLPFSIASMLDELLQLHNGSGFGSDPTVINHDGLPVDAHIHTYTDIIPSGSQQTIQDRVTAVSTLENDIYRLRYEIKAIKGSSSWYEDPIDPVTSTAGNLNTHMSYVGNGTVSEGNPHGTDYIDLGLEPIFDAITAYTGMTSLTDDSPAYNNNNYIINGDSLVTAISKLDSQISLVSLGNAIRGDYFYNRSDISETDREQTPIIINHNMGRKPLVQVTDISDSEQDYYGQYISPDNYLNIVHIDNNEFQIWTNAAIIEVVAIY